MAGSLCKSVTRHDSGCQAPQDQADHLVGPARQVIEIILKHERTDEGLHGAGDGSARLVERRLALELARFAPLDDDQRQDFLDPRRVGFRRRPFRSEEHTSELQSLMRISYAVFCLKKKKK